MKYLVMDIRKNKVYVEEFSDKEEAIKFARADFLTMCETGKKLCKSYIVLETINPAEESENHYDGNVICTLK